MRVSLKWLKDYIDIDIGTDELGKKLTMSGFEVEGIECLTDRYKNFVVGEVIDVIRHPNAEKLTLCRVSVGREILQIICGAPNVAKGQKVPVALTGAEIPRNQHDPEGGPFTLSDIKIRGIRSAGMICSSYELNMGEEKSGIMVLSPEAAAGTPLTEYLEADDTIFDVGITPNRPDAMSHIGIAREIGSILGKTIKIPEIRIKESSKKITDYAHISVKESVKCPRYTSRVILNVKIDQSPAWMQKYLKAVGIRPVNNIVDVTNFVLMECGHPLHAFDYDKISEKTIIVNSSEEGQRFTTLDHKVRLLPADTIMICDKKGAIAIAGVMGGENSEISESTRNVLLESAYFQPKCIRIASKKLGISSDASQRFERGADPNITLWAVNRAAQLIHEFGNGEILEGVIDVYAEKIVSREISLRPEKVNQILGLNLSGETISGLLKKFQIEESTGGLESADGTILRFTVPTFRPDIEREIDLIEEIARAYGYDKIEVKTTALIHLPDIVRPEELHDELRRNAIRNGMTEVVTNSMEDKPAIESLSEKRVKISNPISQDMRELRTSLIPSLLKIVRHNIYHGIKNLRLFEIGKVYFHGGTRSDREFVPGYIEEERLLLIFTGLADHPAWDQKPRFLDIFDVKGEISSFFQKISLDNIKFIPYSTTDALTEYELTIENNGEYIGRIGILLRDFLNGFDIEQDVYFAEIDVDKIAEQRDKSVKFKKLPKFPPVTRDLAVVVDASVPIEKLENEIKFSAGTVLENLNLFDIYTGDQIQSGKKSCAFALEFRAQDRTLKQNEVDIIMEKITKDLGTKFMALVRK